MHTLKLGLAATALTVGLVACPGGNPPPTVTPTKASVNGFTLNADKSANLNVSALDNSNNVLRSGTLSDPSVSGASVLARGVRTLDGTPVTATASVCGNITSVSGALTAGILMDASGSMSDTDPTKLRATAAKAFVDRLQSGDVAAVTSFSSGLDVTPPYTEITVHQAFTDNKALLKTAVDAAAVDGGSTPLWVSTKETVDVVQKRGGGNKVALVLTDGAADDADQLQAAINAAKAANVRLLMIGLGSNLSDADMQRAAADTGGLYAVASDAAGLNTVFNGAFNASQGAGCIKLAFTPQPTAGQKVTGTLSFKANGTTLNTPFNVQY
jgi:hypothetical protein